MRRKESRHEPLFMHPAVFISGSIAIGQLFALHDWIAMRHMGYLKPEAVFFSAWGAQFFMLGGMCWLVWRFGRDLIERAKLPSIILFFLPLSVVIGLVEEMVWVVLFPRVPLNRPHMDYWQRLTFILYEDLFEDLVIFWCAFFLFRGICYYQRYRENEQTAAQLQVQLANAQISALRMQMNPHFLFNTMNSISSLMRSNIEAADTMLEQLSSLMRITLERGDAQLIPLRDELDFIELFLEMQAHRYAGRITQSMYVDPELYDSLVPAMVLQPIIENAYVHGLSKVETRGELSIDIERDDAHVRIRVTNSGPGLRPSPKMLTKGHGVGLANIRNRLKLHYGEEASLSITELNTGQVQVTILLPLQFAEESQRSLAGYSTQ